MKKIDLPLLNCCIYLDTINKMPTFFIKKTGFKSIYAGVNIHFGSIVKEYSYQNKTYSVSSGAAHLMEHLTFNLDEEDASIIFESLGATTNAYTTYDATCFYFNTIKNFDQCLKLLLDMVFIPSFNELKLKKEKPIVISEIKEGLEKESIENYLTILDSLYFVNPIKEEIAGTVESVKSIDVEELNRVHEAFYKIANSHLVIIGDFEAEKIYSKVKELTNSYQNCELPIIKQFKEPKKIKEKEIFKTSDKLTRDFVSVQYKLNIDNIDSKDNFILERSLHLINMMLSSPDSYLVKHLEEEHLLNPTFTYECFLLNYATYFQFKIKLVDSSRFPTIITDSFKKIKENITVKQLEKQKRNMIISEISSYNSYFGLVEQADNYMLKALDINEQIKLINSITMDDIYKAIDLIDFDNYTVFISKPRK